MDCRTIVITGANSGIGYATATVLARKGHRLFVAARTLEKARSAASELIARSGNDAIVPVWGDFRRLSEVRMLASQILERTDCIDVLINNAGRLSFAPRDLTEDGNMTRLQVNFLAPFLLTNLLLDAIRRAQPARIVNVSSASHRLARRIDLDDIQFEKKYNGFAAFCRTKAFVNLFTVALSDRYGNALSAYSVHPGIVRSNFNQDMRLTGVRAAAAKLAALFMKRPEDAAAAIAYLALTRAVPGANGGYFSSFRPAKPAAFSVDSVTASRLWQAAAAAVQLANE